MKFTKILSLLLAVIMVMAMFVACDSSSRDDDDDDDDETKKKKTDKIETTAEPDDTFGDPFDTTDSFDQSVDQNVTVPDTSKEPTDSADNPTDTTTPSGDNTMNTGNSTDQPTPPEPDEPQYEITYLADASEGLILFKTNERKYGFMDLSGNVVIEPEFEWADSFYNGRASIRKEVNGEISYGYIDRNGKVVIDCIYDSYNHFESNIVCLSKDGVEMFVDLNGNVIYTLTGDEAEIGKVSNGWFWIETVKSTLAGDTHYLTYYNVNGKAFTIENAGHYKMYYNNSSQSDMNEWGYAVISLLNGEDEPQNVIIDSTGKQPEWIYGLVDENTYLSVDELDGSYAEIITPDPESDYMNLSYTAYLDFEGQTAKIATYPHPNELGNGYFYDYVDEELTIIKDDKIFLNVGAIEAFKPAEINNVDLAYIGGKDYFIVYLTNSAGTGFQAVIDAEGNVVIEPTNEYTFEVPYLGTNFLMICTYKNYERLYGFMDIEGNILTEPTYEDTNINEVCTYNGVTGVVINNGTTLVDLNGNVIFNVETAS